MWFGPTVVNKTVHSLEGESKENGRTAGPSFIISQ